MKESLKNIYFIKRAFIAVLIVLIAFFVTDLKAEKINSIVAIVNDEIITNFDVLQRTAIAIQEAEKSYDPSMLEAKKHEFYDEALKELINRKVLVQTAQKAMLNNELKMDEIEKDVDTFIKNAAAEVGSLSKFYEIVNEQGMDPIEKKRELRDDLMVEKILKESVYRKVSVQPKETKAYYNSHLEDYHLDRQISFRQILIKFPESDDANSAKLEAEKLMKELNGGADFAGLAKRSSQGSHAENGGLWTADEVNDLRKDLRDAVYKLKEGETSSIIESSIGYHIILCEENKADAYESFKDVQDNIYQKLFREKFNQEKEKYIEELKKSFFIKKY